MPRYKQQTISNKRQVIILGIDPGLADTGFGLVKKTGSKLEMIDYGNIKTKAKLPLPIRLNEIHQALDRLIKKHKPAVIGVEQLFFCKNVKTAIAVGQARGVILLTAGQHSIPIEEFTPLQVKMALTSYGHASKKQVQQMVKTLLKLKTIPKPDDASDALAVAICCTHSAALNNLKIKN